MLLAGCGGTDSADGGGDDPSRTPEATAAAPTAPPVDEAELKRLKALTKLALKAQEAAAKLNAAGGSIPPRDGPVLGADISWPQCPPGMGIPYKESSGQPMPRPDAEYVVIGLTNGPGFHANPCLADQVAYAKEHELLVAAYSVISWPDEAAQEQYGGLEEAGHAQAQFNLQSMKAAGLDSPIIWLDVEQVPHYEWSTSTAANAEVVLGAAQGLRRGRLPRGRLLHPRHLVRHRRRPQPGRAGVASGRPDLAGGGTEPVRRRLADPGRRRRARAVGRGGAGPEHHVPGDGGATGGVLRPAVTKPVRSRAGGVRDSGMTVPMGRMDA